MKIPLTTRIKISTVVFDQTIYPRLTPDLSLIQKYRDAIDKLPPIVIDRKNRLIDGYHRWQSMIAEGIEEIDTVLFDSDNDRECVIESIRLNATHGKQLSQTEKKELARKMYLQNVDETQIQTILSVSERTLRNYLRDVKEEQISKRDKGIKELWENGTSIRRIAEIMGLSKSRVNEIVSTFGKVAETGQLIQLIPTVRQPCFNWWENREDLLTTRPKKLPVWAIENFLYFFTSREDVIMEYGNTEIASNFELVCHSWDRKHVQENYFSKPESADPTSSPDFIFFDEYTNAYDSEDPKGKELFERVKTQLNDIADKTGNLRKQPVIAVTVSSDKWRHCDIHCEIWAHMVSLGMQRVGEAYVIYSPDSTFKEEFLRKKELMMVCQEILLFSRDTESHLARMFREAWAAADGIIIEEGQK